MKQSIRIQCVGVNNGFRTPLSHSVHDTLPLPPPTTLIGLLGAAAGVSRKDMWNLYQKFQVGVIGSHLTSFTDLTKIIKYKGQKTLSSLLSREMLFNTKFTIWYIPTGDLNLEYVLKAFKNPKYALSLGRDDELIRIDEAKKVYLEPEPNPILNDTILPFSLDPVKDKIVGSSEVMFPLVSLPLPRSFKINSDMSRTPTDFQQYTFLENYGLKTKREGCFSDGEYRFFAL